MEYSHPNLEVGTPEWELAIGKFMKKCFKPVPTPKPPVWIGSKARAEFEKFFSKQAIQEWEAEKQLELHQNNLKKNKNLSTSMHLLVKEGDNNG